MIYFINMFLKTDRYIPEKGIDEISKDKKKSPPKKGFLELIESSGA